MLCSVKVRDLRHCWTSVAMILDLVSVLTDYVWFKTIPRTAIFDRCSRYQTPMAQVSLLLGQIIMLLK
jgi:hypothetical protein